MFVCVCERARWRVDMRLLVHENKSMQVMFHDADLHKFDNKELDVCKLNVSRFFYIYAYIPTYTHIYHLYTLIYTQ